MKDFFIMALLKNLAESLTKRVIPEVAQQLFPKPFEVVKNFEENLEKAKAPYEELSKGVNIITSSFGGMRPALKKLQQQAKSGRFGMSAQEKEDAEMKSMGMDMGTDDMGDFADLDALMNDGGGDSTSSSMDLGGIGDIPSMDSDTPVEVSNTVNYNKNVNAIKTGVMGDTLTPGEGLISEKIGYQTSALIASNQLSSEIANEMNRTLSGLANFNAEQTMEHYRQSEEYYKLSADYQGFMRETIPIISDYYKAEKERKENAEANKMYKSKEFSLDDMLSPERLMKKFTEGPAGMLFGEMGAGMIAGEAEKFKQDPLGTIISTGLASTISSVFERQLNSINRFIDDIPFQLQNTFTRWSNNADQDGFMNQALGVIGNFLKIDTPNAKNVKLNRIMDGPVDFDGKTRDAIVRGIPMYLSQIAYNTAQTNKLILRSNILDSSAKKKALRDYKDKDYQIYDANKGIMISSKKERAEINKRKREIEQGGDIGDSAINFARSAGLSKAEAEFFKERFLEASRSGDISKGGIENQFSAATLRQANISNLTKYNKDIFSETKLREVLNSDEFKEGILNAHINSMVADLELDENIRPIVVKKLQDAAIKGKFHELNFDKIFSAKEILDNNLGDINDKISSYAMRKEENISDMKNAGTSFITDVVGSNLKKVEEAKSKMLADKEIKNTVRNIVSSSNLKGEDRTALEDELLKIAINNNGELKPEDLKSTISKVIKESKKGKYLTDDMVESRASEALSGIQIDEKFKENQEVLKKKFSDENLVNYGITADEISAYQDTNKRGFINTGTIASRATRFIDDEERGGAQAHQELISKGIRLNQKTHEDVISMSNDMIDDDAMALSQGISGKALNLDTKEKSYLSTKNPNFSGIKGFFGRLGDTLKDLFSGFLNKLGNMFSGMFKGLKNFFKGFSLKFFDFSKFKTNFGMKWKGWKRKISGKKDFGEGDDTDDSIGRAVLDRFELTSSRIKDKIGDILKFNVKNEDGSYKGMGEVVANSLTLGINKATQGLRDWLTGENKTDKGLGESIRIRAEEVMNRFKGYLIGDKDKGKETPLIEALRIKMDDLFGKKLKVAIWGKGADQKSLWDNIGDTFNQATSKLTGLILGKDNKGRLGEEGMNVFKAMGIRVSSSFEGFRNWMTGGKKDEDGNTPSIFSAIGIRANKLFFGDEKADRQGLIPNIKEAFDIHIRANVVKALLGSNADDPRFKDMGIIGSFGFRLNQWMFGEGKAKENTLIGNLSGTLGRFFNIAMFGMEKANNGKGLWGNIKDNFSQFTDNIGERLRKGLWEPTKSYFSDLVGPTIKELFAVSKDEVKHYLKLSKDWFTGDFLKRTEGFMGKVFGDDVAQMFRENLVVPLTKLTDTLKDNLSKALKFLFRLPINLMRGIVDTVKLKRLNENRGNYSPEEVARLRAMEKKGSTFDFNRSYDDNKKLADLYAPKKKGETVTLNPNISSNPAQAANQVIQNNSPKTKNEPNLIVTPIPSTPAQRAAEVIQATTQVNNTTNNTSVAPNTTPTPTNIPITSPAQAANQVIQNNQNSNIIPTGNNSPVSSVPVNTSLVPNIPIFNEPGEIIGKLKGNDLSTIARDTTVDLAIQQSNSTKLGEIVKHISNIAPHVESIDSKMSGKSGNGMESGKSRRSGGVMNAMWTLVKSPFSAILSLGAGFASGIAKLAKLPGKAISALGSAVANIGSGILSTVPAITKAIGSMIGNLGKIGASLFEGLGTVLTVLSKGAVSAAEGLFKFAASIAGPALRAIGSLAEGFIKGLKPAIEGLASVVSTAIEGLMKFGTFLLDKGFQLGMGILSKGASLIGRVFGTKTNPFARSEKNNITNWNELISLSRATPLNVYVVDGKIQTYVRTKRVAKTGLDNIENRMSLPIPKKKDKEEDTSNPITDLLKGAASTALGTAAVAALAKGSSMVNGVVQRGKNMVNGVTSKATTSINEGKNKLGEKLANVKEKIPNSKGNLLQNIKDKATSLKDNVKDRISRIPNVIDPKKPLIPKITPKIIDRTPYTSGKFTERLKTLNPENAKILIANRNSNKLATSQMAKAQANSSFYNKVLDKAKNYNSQYKTNRGATNTLVKNNVLEKSGKVIPRSSDEIFKKISDVKTSAVAKYTGLKGSAKNNILRPAKILGNRKIRQLKSTVSKEVIRPAKILGKRNLRQAKNIIAKDYNRIKTRGTRIATVKTMRAVNATSSFIKNSVAPVARTTGQVMGNASTILASKAYNKLGTGVVGNTVAKAGYGLGKVIEAPTKMVMSAGSKVSSGLGKFGARVMDPSKGVNVLNDGGMKGAIKGAGVGILANIAGGALIDKFTTKGGAANDTLHGALNGAGWGATIGSILPGVGNVIGAGIGAVIGALDGVFKHAVKWVEDKFGEEITEATKTFVEFPNKLSEWIDELPKRIDKFTEELPSKIMSLFEAPKPEDIDPQTGEPKQEKPSILWMMMKALGRAGFALIQAGPKIGITLVEVVTKMITGVTITAFGFLTKGIVKIGHMFSNLIEDTLVGAKNMITKTLSIKMPKWAGGETWTPFGEGESESDRVKRINERSAKQAIELQNVDDGTKEVIRNVNSGISGAANTLKNITGANAAAASGRDSANLGNNKDKYNESMKLANNDETKAKEEYVKKHLISKEDEAAAKERGGGAYETLVKEKVAKLDQDINWKQGKEGVAADKRADMEQGGVSKLLSGAGDLASKYVVQPVMTRVDGFAKLMEELKKSDLSLATKAALLGNVAAESGFVAKSEDLNYSSVERLRKVFPGRLKHLPDSEVQKLVNNPQALGDTVYKPLGGYKYRGRGHIQITGLSNYAKYSKMIFGDDRLVQNPDLANDPTTSAKLAIAYVKDRAGPLAPKKFGRSLNELSPSESALAITQAVAGEGTNLSSGYLKELTEKKTGLSLNFMEKLKNDSSGENIKAELPKTKTPDIGKPVVATNSLPQQSNENNGSTAASSVNNVASNSPASAAVPILATAAITMGYNPSSNSPATAASNVVSNSENIKAKDNVDKITKLAPAAALPTSVVGSTSDNITAKEVAPNVQAFNSANTNVIKNANNIITANVQDTVSKANLTGSAVAMGVKDDSSKESSITNNILNELQKQTVYLATIANNGIDSVNLFSDFKAEVNKTNENLVGLVSNNNSNIVSMTSMSNRANREFNSIRPSETALKIASGGN